MSRTLAVCDNQAPTAYGHTGIPYRTPPPARCHIGGVPPERRLLNNRPLRRLYLNRKPPPPLRRPRLACMEQRLPKPSRDGLGTTPRVRTTTGQHDATAALTGTPTAKHAPASAALQPAPALAHNQLERRLLKPSTSGVPT
ncbi:hypothetical protein WOLCODRAFT_147238 [Wolfiporia cocos MD-104 SS10]|uniref:Uncharacterized protein n=1 Tax=Wolfiporia cocos (strain MD-104) TaxID=742152 RepID=A0A2H3J662_WOLCO|nr:hypothetical protein WOLCODRAFT_147238 [Wolfiporia cocos MD-104 SS10]